MKHKIKYIFILVVMLSIVLGIQKNVTALSTSTSTFQASWNTVINYRELLCSNENKSFAGYTYKFQKDGGLHTSTKGKRAWILSTAGDPQAAWWHIIHNDNAHPETQLNKNADLYESYMDNYTKPEITNLTKDGDGNVTFNLSGIEKEIKGEVHFGKIEKALIVGTELNGAEKEIDITSNVNYGSNTISASLLTNMQKIKIKIRTDHTTAEGRWQNYKAYQRYYSGAWHNIKTGSQPLAIFDGSRNYGNDLAVSSELMLKTNVSMQKYITKVNGIAISSRDAYLAGSKVENIPSGTAWNKDVKSEINKISTYKDANPVTIEPGDTVTYKIIIYNNTGVKQNVTVTDSITNSMHNGKYDMEWKTEGWSITGTTDTRTQYSKTISVSANGSYILEVEIKFNGESSSDDVSYYKNKAWISGTNGTNTTSYRTADGDFIKMKKYKVSIEKYVSGVKSTGKNGTNLITDSNSTLYNCNTSNREGHPTYNNNSLDKSTDPVQVEIGDTITYTIIIRNTGTDTNNWGSIKVSEVFDKIILSSQESQEYNMDAYFSGIWCSKGVSYSRGKFNNLNVTIPVGGYYDFTVIGTLTGIPIENTSQSVSIENKATVKTIKNTNNYTVIDSDGETNNKDSDWIKTKIYAVSLKKYVSNVSGQETGSIDTSSWETLKNYIGKDSSKYEGLKEKVKNIKREDVLSAINKSNITKDNLIDYLKYDLNGDGKVTEEDYNIYLKESATQGTDANQLKKLIQNFIDSDLNKDNKVDNTDLMLFKQVISDVNGNGNIEEEQDIYEWDLLRIKAANRLNEDYLKKIKIAILQRELKINSQVDTVSELEYYIKSDVNDDGIVDENDNIKSYENKNNLNEEEISNFIENNDINLDGLVNGLDIDVERQLSNQKEDLKQYNNIKKYLQNIKNVEYDENGNLTEEYKECDINNDEIIDILDYISQIDNSDLLEKLNQLESIKLSLVIYDYNSDRIINEDDYAKALELSGNVEDEKAVVYLNALKDKNINIELSDIDDETYRALKEILVAQEELGKLDYDLIGNRILNHNDLQMAKEQSNYQVIDYLDSILNNTQNNSGINSIKINIEDYMDFNKDERVDYSDKELLLNYLLCPDDIWEKIENETRDELTQDNIDYYDLNNDEEVSVNDIIVCKVLSLKSYTELIDIFKNLDLDKLDINSDGIVSGEDIEIYNQYIESCDKKEENIGKLTFYEIRKKDDEGKLEEYYQGLKDRIENSQTDETDIGYDINKNGSYSDEKELVEQYMLIKENEDYIKEVKDNIDLLDLNFDGQIDENDYNICKVLSGNKVYDYNMKEKINLYDITDDGKADGEDISAVNTLYSELADVEISTIDYYNYIKENMYRETFELNRADVTRDYLNDSITINKEDKDKLNEYIQQYKGNYIDTFYDITNTSENIINNLIENKDRVTLDINNDGKIDKNDKEILDVEQTIESGKSINNLKKENFEKYINEPIANLDINDDGEINQEDIDIISKFTNCDLNGDGFVNSTDLELFEQTTAAINNKEMENAIYEYCKLENNKVDTWKGDRTGFSPVYKDSNYKKDRPVTVQQGDYVTYTIKVQNDGSTDVYITNILDDLPEAYVTYNGEVVDKINRTDLSGTMISGTPPAIQPKKSATITVTVQVTASNMCIDLIENTAEIYNNEITNRNSILVKDSTPSDNKDSDYIQLRDIDISGNIWNDKALNKGQNTYNGVIDKSDNTLIDEAETNIPKPIYVTLYRHNGDGTNIEIKTITTTTGHYKFTSRGDNPTITETKIKASYITTDGYYKWNEGGYYSYYVVFTYDGVTYTSTPEGNTYVKVEDEEAYQNNTYKINSNAREKLNVNSEFDGYVEYNKTRQAFNSRFGKITEGEAQYDNKNDTKSMDIYYNTRNETGYIPQSNHKSYDSNGNLLEGYKIQSSTNLIQLSNKADLEEQLQYVNLGLRGRDIFDLELTSDVAKVEVKVNNKPGVYNYTNKVTIRDSDVRKQNIKNGEDMANKSSEASNEYVEDRDGEEGQQLNNTDLNISSDYTHANRNNYDDTQGLQDIKVTYKITVTNASQTNGIATVITDYYDKCYTNPENAYIEIKMPNGEIRTSSKVEIKKMDKTSNSKYNKVNLHVKDAIEEILVEDGMLTQSQSYNLYFTLTMTDQGIYNLKKLFQDNKTLKYPTYNMAEIRKYKTACGENQTEYTRGLIDKDSAPGSVETEKVRLTTTESSNVQETNGSPSTVEYYFSKRTDDKVDLSKLKYEDDTYATPTLYFTSSERERKIEGTVFEDYTEIINNNDDNELVRTKTGNGIQDGDEPGINGATVELIELVKVSEDETKEEIRYSTTTDYKNKESKEGAGYYSFSGYLPGNYIIRYRYGDTEKTFTYNNNPNTKSYNGEDFQSTNNAYDVDGIEIYKLNSTPSVWYAFNENDKVSTATDNRQRRIDVSTSVTDFSDEEMTVLNNVRDGKNMDAAKVTYKENDTEKQVTAETIRDATKMFATTPAMELTMEETVQNGDETKQNDSFTDYIVSNMNFGIAEVPVTTIDLQKHVYSLKITDSTGGKIAEAQIDTNNAQVTVNPSKIAENKLDVVINVLSKDLGIDKSIIRNLISYDENKGKDTNIIIAPNANKEQTKKLQYDMTMYSLAREITITKTWNVKSENVLAAPGTSVLDISIEDDKLQGAKLEVTYEITASIYAERNFNNDAVVEPSIKGIADYIDNDLSYNEEKIGTQPQSNKEYWTIAKQEELAELYKRAEQIGETQGSENIQRSGTLDPDGIKYTTIVTANNIENGLLVERCGTGTAYITLERLLSSTDSSIGDIIQSSIETYEYDNNLEITGLDYENEGDFIFRDRVRTADRYIILAGRQHDTATSETIAIHPPTGENNSMCYYIIALISLGILATGIILIKKYAIKKDKK